MDGRMEHDGKSSLLAGEEALRIEITHASRSFNGPTGVDSISIHSISEDGTEIIPGSYHLIQQQPGNAHQSLYDGNPTPINPIPVVLYPQSRIIFPYQSSVAELRATENFKSETGMGKFREKNCRKLRVIVSRIPVAMKNLHLTKACFVKPHNPRGLCDFTIDIRVWRVSSYRRFKRALPVLPA